MFFEGSGGGALGCLLVIAISCTASISVIAAQAAGRLTPDGYFLSATNPLATADQRDLEALALRIDQTPPLLAAKETAKSRWKILAGANAPAEAWPRFDEFIDEYVLHYTLKAIDADANYPRVVRVNMLPHDWFGMRVPGSRQSGGDNPDNTYALIPVDYGGHFAITGQRFEPAPADVTYTLAGNLSPTMTLGMLEGRNQDGQGRALHHHDRPRSEHAGWQPHPDATGCAVHFHPRIARRLAPGAECPPRQAA